jgi:hypothetical protein
MKEGDNFEGISILRNVYGNWIRKELYLKLDMIGLEKMSVGTPIFYVPSGQLNDATELAKIEAIGESYTSHEKQYLILDAKLKEGGFEIKSGEYHASDVDTAIKREDAAILDSILASFLMIGTQRAGGNSQNEGQTALFLNSLLSVSNYITENLDRLTSYYFNLNFGVPEVGLKMKISGITKDDAKVAMDILRGYITSGAIRADDRLEAKLRMDLALPDADLSTARIDAKGDPNLDKTEADTAIQEPQANPEDINTD